MHINTLSEIKKEGKSHLDKIVEIKPLINLPFANRNDIRVIW